MDTKKKMIYIGAAVVLLLIVLLIIVLISRANHVAEVPVNTPAPTYTPAVEATPTSTPKPTPSPTPTPEPTPTEEIPSITPPAETVDPASGSDIVLTTAVPSTATDIEEEALKELIAQAQAAEEAKKGQTP